MPYCKNCAKNFELTDREKDFYLKLGTKTPTHCFDCRMQRKYAFRNERKMYNRQCDSCHKAIISMYTADAPFPVYCLNCWYGDSWEGLSFGRDFDFSRSIFSQLAELQNEVPRICLASTSDCVNSPYISWTDRAKNCHLIYSSSICEDCMYSETLVDCRDCVDCTNVKESENCYFSIDLQKCYNVKFSRNLKGYMDCDFCFDCAECSNCFLSCNLRHQQYCIRNVKYSPPAYAAEVNRIMSHRSELAKSWNDFLQMMKHQAIHKFANLTKSEEVEGDELYACQRSFNSFDSREIQDCFNIIYGDKVKDCSDSFAIVDQAELCLEVFSVNGGYQNMYGFGNWDKSNNVIYSNGCISCRDCLACIGLKNKQYCILNKQYTEEEYKSLSTKILEHMKRTEFPSQTGDCNEWGEFFPVQMSPFAYNETMAAVYYPLSKEEVLTRGWGWREESAAVKGQETVKSDELPETLAGTPEDITSQVLACAQCQRNYKIISQELAFYKKHNLPLPKFCPECHFKERLALRNPRKLWPRQCNCLLKHPEEHNGKCLTKFKTTYRPDGSEKVFCEECYQKEIY